MATSNASTAAKEAEKAAKQAEADRDKQLKEAEKAREEEFKEAQKNHDSDDAVHTPTGAIRQPVDPTVPYTTVDPTGTERIVSPAAPNWEPKPVKADPAQVALAKERVEREEKARKERLSAPGARGKSEK